MKSYFLAISCLLIFWSCNENKTTQTKEFTLADVPVIAPFEGIDTLAINDWWNRATTKIINLKVNRDSVVAFGMYTVSNNILKLSAQLYPLYPDETREVRLEIKDGENWNEIQKKNVNDIGWSALFRVESWDSSKDIPYRLLHGEKAYFEGLIRKDPKKDEIVLAAFSCNSNKDRGMRENYIRNVDFHNPDLLFFAGDQSYDHTEHTAAWLKFGLQFKELFKQLY